MLRAAVFRTYFKMRSGLSLCLFLTVIFLFPWQNSQATTGIHQVSLLDNLRPVSPEPMVFFAKLSGSYMHSNQMMMVHRVVGLARLLKARVLPLYVSHGWAMTEKPAVPLEVFYDALPDTDGNPVFLDPNNVDDIALIKRTLNRVSAIAQPSSSLHQFNNTTPLDIPCLIGESSLYHRISVSSLQQPFGCRELIILKPEITHPTSRTRDLQDLAHRLAGQIVGLPQPFMLNVSCELELFGASLTPPKALILRAVKWLLWNAILQNRSAAGLMDRLAADLTIPELDSKEHYSKYPVADPLFISAHIRAAPNAYTYCGVRMRYPLCGTTETMAAKHLARKIALASAAQRPVSVYIAGDLLRPKSTWGKSDLQVSDLVGESKDTKDVIVMLSSRLHSLVKPLFSHPSINLTSHPSVVAYGHLSASEAFLEVIAIIVDQLLLACGRHIGGEFYQTYVSTFSTEAWFLAQTVGAQACKPRYATTLHGKIARWSSSLTPLEEHEEKQAIHQAQVVFHQEMQFGRAELNISRPAGSLSGKWAQGCSTRGTFLPSIPWAERLRMQVGNQTRAQFGEGRW